nr:MAG TPA: hypothetical protein [Caudoviricetes sp.]
MCSDFHSFRTSNIFSSIIHPNNISFNSNIEIIYGSNNYFTNFLSVYGNRFTNFFKTLESLQRVHLEWLL